MADPTHPPMVPVAPRDPLVLLPPAIDEMGRLARELDYDMAYKLRGFPARVRLAARIRLVSDGGPVESPLADYPEGWR